MFWTEMLLNPNIIGLCFSTVGLKMMKEGKILYHKTLFPSPKLIKVDLPIQSNEYHNKMRKQSPH
jgi:hypothetical protein